MPKSNWSAYKKYYSAKWESEPLLKEWICSVPGDRTRAACRLCHLTIRAHHGDLVKHANTATHKRYVEGRSSNAARFLKAAGANAVARKRQENDQKITDLKISAYIACHTSINAVDHIGENINECAKHCNCSKNTLSNLQLHRTKCTNLIKNVIGPEMKKQ